MNKLLCIILVLLCADLMAKDVSGTQNGVWKLTDSPIRIVGDVTVPVGDTLVFKPT